MNQPPLNRRSWPAVAVALALVASVVVVADRALAQPPDLVPVLYGPTTISDTAREEIPADLLVVYREVAAESSCALPWPILAGIADTATDHGRVHNAERRPDGALHPGIVGPALDGQQGRRLAVDTDGGLWDDDATFDRALGLFQFIPRTWRHYAADGNGDGVRDPQNVWDEAVAASEHLCAEGGEDSATVDDAITVYYDSPALVPDVLAAALRYVDPGASGSVRSDSIGIVTASEGGALQLVADPTSPNQTTPVGSPGDQPVIADWDGDGDDDIGVSRIIEGANVFVFGPGDQADADIAVLGQPGDIALAGDWDGDGSDEPGVFRSFNGRGRFLRFQRDGTALGPVDFGRRGDQPVVGDWDGDGIDEPGVYRTDGQGQPGWFLRGDANGNALGRAIQAGTQGDRAVIGDWDGDGIDTLGIHTPSRPAGAERTVPTFIAFDRSGVASGQPAALAFDGQVLAGRAPAEDIPVPAPLEAPQGTDELVALPGVEYFGIGSGPEGISLRLWRINGIIVEEGIAPNVAAMVQAAAADGIDLTAWGWRSHERQIELRRQNCADVWESPASSCRPPTARPGTSRHEFGRALDVHVDGQVISASSPVFAWLQANAATFGLFNLPSEPWHWSDTGG
ncbi:MAG: D-alanyl-D-alanine carboxypeptidase family protein [Acidimicrobiia bacterium]|nr:D-alanyl-D-alanine carboxypeptidase family protein [Acidimicrobiia bacterium]